MFSIKPFPLYVSFLVLLSVACNKLTTSPALPEVNTSAVGVYPHAEDFKKKTHGAVYLADKQICVSCHAQDGSGGSAKVSCTTCHSTYPHSSAWALAKNHGEKYANSDSKTQASCISCHSSGQSAKLASCTDCHKAFPHSQDFEAVNESHSEIARTYEGKCTLCHTDQKKYMYKMGSCQFCHTGKLVMDWVTESASLKNAQRETASKKSIKSKKTK